MFFVPARCSAQQPKVLAPHKPVAPRLARHREWDPPAVSQSATGGLWMINANSKSTLYLGSMLKSDSLTVTPVLHLSNGAQYTLPPVTLEPSGTAAININQALAVQGIAPYATLYGYAEVQYQWGWDAICGTVWNVDTLHSLIFIDTLRPPPTVAASPAQDANAGPVPPQLLEGMWWKQESNVTGFVALSNVTAKPVSASVQVLDSANQKLGEHTVIVSPHGTKMIELNELLSASTPTGGRVVTWTGRESELMISASLKDQAVGYSARLPLGPRPAASAAMSQNSYSELGLMSGMADPMMNFPGGTMFTPYSVLRNISDQTISVTPTLWWMQGGAAHSAQLAALTAAPHQTQTLDVPALLTGAGLKNFNGSVNLVLDAKGPQGALLLSSGSVDQKDTYVFEVVPRGIAQSASKGLPYWSTGNGNDTMITVWNPADEAQDFIFTLFYTGGHYGYPIHLEPRATQSFNVSEIIHSRIPDAEGNVIPLAVQDGSAEISGPLGENQEILVALDGGIYNVQKATCGGFYCTTCNGEQAAWIVDNPFAVAVSGNKQEIFEYQYNTGTQYDVTSTSSWNSSNTGVATVSAGMTNGVAVGSVTISGLYGQVPQYSHPCADSPPSCSSFISPSASAPGTTVDFTLSGSQSIMDGQQGTFSVSVTRGTATAYQWSFTAPSGAGNSPNVNFTAATSAQTNTDGHWFALPNVACPSTSDLPNYYNAVYAIEAQVTFSEGPKPSKSTTLTVDSYWNPAGVTDPNVARIGGLPAMASDGPNGTGTWRVTGMGTLSRVVPTSSTIYVISTSQFYNKTVQHEQVHVNNWILGTGHLYGDLYIPSDFYNQITGITGTSQDDLINKLSAALTTYVNSQGAIYNQRVSTDEHQAYLVSDAIAPQYVYQNCGRF